MAVLSSKFVGTDTRLQELYGGGVYCVACWWFDGLIRRLCRSNLSRRAQKRIRASLSCTKQHVVGLLGFFIGLSIAVVASPAAVKVFGTQLREFWREASCGNSKLAYVVGKFFGFMPRIMLSALHFTGLFYTLVRPRTPLPVMFGMAFCYFFCTFGVAIIISILFYKSNSALIAVIVTMALSSLCGFSPSVATFENAGVGGLMYLFYARWCTGAFYAAELSAWGPIFDVSQTLDETGFTLESPATQLGYAAVVGTVFHIISWVVLMLSTKFKKG
eukprot:m.100122 g.100122  ORF g.100122 m.100122 type:complete len:274 (-) comp13158_c0_seq7:292-1113(-)